MFDTQSQVRRLRRGHLRVAGHLAGISEKWENRTGNSLTWLPMEAGGGRSATRKDNRRPQNRREQCTASGPAEKDEPLLGEQFGDCP